MQGVGSIVAPGGEGAMEELLVICLACLYGVSALTVYA